MSVAKPIFENPEYVFDLRVRERNLHEEKITAEQVQEYLDALPDSEEVAEFVDLPAIEPAENVGDIATRKDGEAEDGQDELLTEEL